jgi:hypothetical protein
MLGRLQRSGRMGRQVAAAVLIFALLLQSMAFAVAAGGLAADDTAGAAFELCRHDAGAAAQPGSAPESPAADRHCVFCLAGATFVLGTPAHAPQFRTIVLAIAPWKFVAWRLPALTVDASARPRGPPQAA